MKCCLKALFVAKNFKQISHFQGFALVRAIFIILCSRTKFIIGFRIGNYHGFRSWFLSRSWFLNRSWFLSWFHTGWFFGNIEWFIDLDVTGLSDQDFFLWSVLSSSWVLFNGSDNILNINVTKLSKEIGHLWTFNGHFEF